MRGFDATTRREDRLGCTRARPRPRTHAGTKVIVSGGPRILAPKLHSDETNQAGATVECVDEGRDPGSRRPCRQSGWGRGRRPSLPVPPVPTTLF